MVTAPVETYLKVAEAIGYHLEETVTVFSISHYFIFVKRFLEMSNEISIIYRVSENPVFSKL